MQMFGNLTTDNLEDTGDRLGAGGVLESGAKDGIIKLIYAGKSQSSKAQSITVHIDFSGHEFRETFWVTNKDNENFYTDKNDASKKHPLPGFTVVDDLCLLTTGQGLSQQNFEAKTINLYNFTERKDVPTEVPVLVDLIGKPISVGLLKEVVDKQKKDAGGNYVNTGETREQNIVDKFFHPETHMTVTEYKENMEEAAFYPLWVEKNTGKVRNKAKGAQGQQGRPGGTVGGLGAGNAQVGRTGSSLFADN